MLRQTYLGAQCRFFMEASTDKHAVFWCCNFTLAPYSNATWMPYHFAHHVLSRMTVSTVFQLFHVHFTPANWPFCDVIWPYIGSHRGRGLAEPEIVRVVVLDQQSYIRVKITMRTNLPKTLDQLIFSKFY